MKVVAITQRVDVDPRYGERRDGLDQRWFRLLETCGIAGLPLPNNAAAAKTLLGCTRIDGILLTGGNDIAQTGGDTPERDEVEALLLDRVERTRVPLLGVCRGMQAIQARFGVVLEPVQGHVAKRQTIRIEGRSTEVNSYHNFGTRGSVEVLEVWARADDQVVKAVRHASLPIVGIMWHPERIMPFREEDMAFITKCFGTGRAVQ